MCRFLIRQNGVLCRTMKSDRAHISQPINVPGAVTLRHVGWGVRRVLPLCILSFALLLFSGCTGGNQSKTQRLDLTGEWKFNPPTEFFQYRKFHIELKQTGSTITGRLIPLFTYMSEEFAQQRFEGTIQGYQVFLQLVVAGGAKPAHFVGTVEPDGNLMQGECQYSQHPKMKWSANRPVKPSGK